MSEPLFSMVINEEEEFAEHYPIPVPRVGDTVNGGVVVSVRWEYEYVQHRGRSRLEVTAWVTVLPPQGGEGKGDG